MKEFLAAILITVISCNGTFTNSLKSTTYTQPVIPKLQQAYNATVSVLAAKGTPSYGSSIGSGTIIRYRKGKRLLVLTAFHVAKLTDPNNIQIRFKKSNSWKRTMRLVRYKEEVDLALLESIEPEENNGPQATLATYDPPLGGEIWVIGSPRGMERNITRGILSNIIDYKKGKNKYTLYRTDTDIFYGNSGGGVYNHKGELVGVVMAVQVTTSGPFTTTPIPGGGLCISLQHIQDFLIKRD